MNMLSALSDKVNMGFRCTTVKKGKTTLETDTSGLKNLDICCILIIVHYIVILMLNAALGLKRLYCISCPQKAGDIGAQTILEIKRLICRANH